MAIESVAITAGSGTKIAVDTIDTDKQVQYVKLMDGTDGEATPIVGDADGLHVVTMAMAIDDNGFSIAGPVGIRGLDAMTETYGNVGLHAGALDVFLTGGWTPPISAGDENIGNVDIVTVPAPLSVVGSGTEATAMRVTIATDSTGVLSIDDNAGSITIDGSVAISSGTVTTVSTVTSVTAVAGMPTGANATAVQGTVAHDAAAAQNPVQVGAYAVNALPAAVANADLAHLITDLNSRLITLPYANPENTISGCSAALTDTNAANVVATDSGNGLKWYVTDILVTNSHATVGTLVDVEDSAALVLWQGYAAPAGGGFACHFTTPIQTGANTHIHAKNTTTGSSTYVCVSAYKAP